MNIDDPTGTIIACRGPLESGSTSDVKIGSADEREYHAAREFAERRAAKNATTAQARRAHQELAQAHSKIARSLGWPRGH